MNRNSNDDNVASDFDEKRILWLKKRDFPNRLRSPKRFLREEK